MKTLLFFSCLIFPAALHAQSYCSLIVKVVNPDGVEQEGVPIWVEEHDGRTVNQRSIAGGARFCDLGINPVTVTVGESGCYQVIIRQFPLDWVVTKVLSTITDAQTCADTYHGVSSIACSILLRFVDAENIPVKGVLFTPINGIVVLKMKGPAMTAGETDEFGRVLVMLGARGELTGTASAVGYEPVDVKVPCAAGSGRNLRLEQSVSMAKVK